MLIKMKTRIYATPAVKGLTDTLDQHYSHIDILLFIYLNVVNRLPNNEHCNFNPISFI